MWCDQHELLSADYPELLGHHKMEETSIAGTGFTGLYPLPLMNEYTPTDIARRVCINTFHNSNGTPWHLKIRTHFFYRRRSGRSLSSISAEKSLNGSQSDSKMAHYYLCWSCLLTIWKDMCFFFERGNTSVLRSKLVFTRNHVAAKVLCRICGSIMDWNKFLEVLRDRLFVVYENGQNKFVFLENSLKNLLIFSKTLEKPYHN